MMFINYLNQLKCKIDTPANVTGVFVGMDKMKSTALMLRVLGFVKTYRIVSNLGNEEKR